VPIPPSSFAALAGATVLVNLSASNIVIGKSGYRHQLVSQQSARCLAAYLYTSAGKGESTTDLAWDGQALIYENGELLGESERFADSSHLLFADVDLERLSRERMHQTSFGQSVRRHREEVERFDTVSFHIDVPSTQAMPLQRKVARFRMCRRTRASATSAAWRSTTSRCRRWCSGCRRARSRRW
jgi:NAD+ synthase (glutamine-hydrolysing)